MLLILNNYLISRPYLSYPLGGVAPSQVKPESKTSAIAIIKMIFFLFIFMATRYKHKAPHQLGLAAPYPFRDMTGEGALNEELSILHWILDHALRFKP